MQISFCDTLSELRRSRNLSQRKLAADLNISQALLSHYEHGSREPGLPFVCRVCDYFGVSADYLLGRSCENESVAHPIIATPELNKALSENHDPEVRKAVSAYMDAACRRIAAHLCPFEGELFFAEQAAEMSAAELSLIRALLQTSQS